MEEYFSKINIQNGKNASFGTWLNSDELGILMGMPRKEILGFHRVMLWNMVLILIAPQRMK